jgi:hypothetical protein
MPQVNPAGEDVQTLRVQKEQFIAATPDIVWEAVLAEIGPEMRPGDEKPFPMKVELWPGGRWFRDLGENAGHLWGHIQVIKPPNLLEICGPLFMSYPAMNHLQYRLKADGAGTRLTFTHRGVGIFDPEQVKGVDMGWGAIIENIRKAAELRASR